MKLLIEISDVDYERLIASNGFSPTALKGFFEAVKNGKSLNDVLGEIKAVILRQPYEGFELGGFMDGYNTAMVKVLNIINKYKSESDGDE